VNGKRGRAYPRDNVAGKSKSALAESASVSLAFEVHQKHPPHVASVTPNSTLAFVVTAAIANKPPSHYTFGG
jgi:hypothetical protein